MKEESGPRAFFPDSQNKKFVLNDDVGFLITSLKVEGLNRDAIPCATGSSYSSTPIESSTLCSAAEGFGDSSSRLLPFVSSRANALNCPKPLQSTKRLSAPPAVNVKIVQAKLSFLENNKPEFEANNQTFIEVTEETANVNYILSAIQRKWGESYTVVTSDGLQIDDCSGTQGKLLCDLYKSSYGRQHNQKYTTLP